MSVLAFGVNVPPEPLAVHVPPVATPTDPANVAAGEPIQRIWSGPALAVIPEGWAITVTGNVVPGQFAS